MAVLGDSFVAVPGLPRMQLVHLGVVQCRGEGKVLILGAVCWEALDGCLVMVVTVGGACVFGHKVVLVTSYERSSCK